MTALTFDRPCFQHRPLSFDLLPLIQELEHWEGAAWSSRTAGGLGNTEAIPLIAVGGTLNDDFAIAGPLQPTSALAASAPIRQFLHWLQLPLGCCRLVRLPAQTETPTQADHSYHGFRYQPLQVPLLSDPAVVWYCDDQPQHLAVGTLWQVNHYRRYRWVNGSDRPAVHLVIEVPIALALPASLPASLPDPGVSFTLDGPKAHPPQGVAVGWPSRLSLGKREMHPDTSGPSSAPAAVPGEIPLPLVPYQFQILSPEEMGQLLGILGQDIAQSPSLSSEHLSQVTAVLQTFGQAWRQAFERFGCDRRGELTYQGLLLNLKSEVGRLLNRSLATPGQGRWAWTVITSQLTTAPRPVLRKLDRQLLAKRSAQVFDLPERESLPQFDRPIFIVSTPRAGSTLLYETLSQFPDLWSIGEESHDAIEGIPELHPASHGYPSNRLTAAAATPAVTQLLKQRFTQKLQDRRGEAFLALPPEQRPTSIRFLEKTPKNALRVPFLRATFPDARFIFLYREAKENISSLMEGWRSRRFISYYNLPGWAAGDWSFFLPPDWPQLATATVAEIAARQWAVANGQILEDLAAIDRRHWCFVPCAELVRQPRQTLKRISDFADLTWDPELDAKVADTLPVSKMTLSAPSPDKWRKNGQDILAVLPQIQPLIDRLENLYDDVVNAERSK
ncbi:MAG: sulfotransferase [Prochlorothrix sp.]|nr:sulfotransferase [Prochlorothrix sp.]